MSRYSDLADRLRAIGDDLDELSFDLLHDAVAAGESRRPDADKVVTQVRRAVEKAAGLLDGLETE